MKEESTIPLNDSETLNLNALCDQLVEGTLEAEAHAELEQWLERSEAAREHYVRRMQLSASLCDYASEFQGAEEGTPLIPSRSLSTGWTLAAAAALVFGAFIAVKSGFLAPANETAGSNPALSAI
jgi:ferric-dicitrate binding protein FerR (iron transport regulator)